MSNSKDAIKIAAKLYEAQETLQRLLGPKYKGAIAPYKEAIQKGLEARGGDLMAFALGFLTNLKRDGMDGMVIMAAMAAVVEIAEKLEKEEQS